MPEKLLFEWPVEEIRALWRFTVIQVIFENSRNQVPMTARETVHDNSPPDFTCAESFNQSWVFSQLVPGLPLSGVVALMSLVTPAPAFLQVSFFYQVAVPEGFFIFRKNSDLYLNM